MEKTAIENNTRGDWGDKGRHTMMEDEHTLLELVKKEYPGLPYFLYGHSMGSFIVRDYIAEYGDDPAGVTICGTTGTWPDLDQAIALAEKDIEEGKAEESDPKIDDSAMEWMFTRCSEGIKYGNEWICSDPYVQKDHAEDPFDAFTKPTQNRAWLYFLQMIEGITGKEWAEKVSQTLPVYNIAGDQDPVGQYGRGVYETSNWLIDTGHDVQTKLYPGYRHEIHNYKEIKNEVCDGIIDFMDRHI